MRSDIRKIVVITGVMLMTSVVTTFFILNIVITVLTKSYINYIVKMIKRLYLTDTDIVLYGIENQTKVESRMPVRIFGYEGASYRGQHDKKTIVPVITMVLYYGTDRRWTVPANIKSLIKVPDGLDKYVNDVKANVFEIAWLTDDQISKFKSDFKIVANFFVNKRKNEDYIPDDKTTIKHVDEILKFLSVMTGDNRYEKLLADKEGVSNMCDVAQRLEDRGIKKGIEKGNRMIYSLVEEKSISMEKGAEKLGISVEKLQDDMVKAGYGKRMGIYIGGDNGSGN